MKKNTFILLLIFSIKLFGQFDDDKSFGKLSSSDINLTKYDKDTLANALVIKESGNTVFKVEGSNVVIKTKYYFKIKIFNEEGYKHATFKIPLHITKQKKEKLIDIKGITHNGHSKTFLSKNNIFEVEVSENRSETKFTMPNLKSGSIIEVTYTLKSPYLLYLNGWEFQSDIPKLYSHYTASIPGNYVFNKKLNGYLRLTTDFSSVKKRCFKVPYGGIADCEIFNYGIKDIPAFREEKYMTDKDNFISKIVFEPKQFTRHNGMKKELTTTWEVVDREFKRDKNIGVQLKKEKFFDKIIPENIKIIPDKIKKAKVVYSFIQDYFSWNKRYGLFEAKIKHALESRAGSVSELNISLINALKSVGLDAELMLISTRKNGFPTKLHPVLLEFNYVIAKLNIDDKSYLLDVTDKLMPFGQLPYRCLNSYGRVMDFKNDSYWHDINAVKNSKTTLYANLILDENGSISGKIRKIYTGYDAYFFRKENTNKDENELIDEFERNYYDLEVSKYEVKNISDIDKPIIEEFEISLNTEDASNIFLNPFFDEKTTINPFKQEDRLYPVDFGYSKEKSFHFSIEIPENYTLKSFPKTKNIVLPNDGGFLSLATRKYGDFKLTLKSSLLLKKPLYYKSDYQYLKELFRQAIITQKTPIVLTKKTSVD